MKNHTIAPSLQAQQARKISDAEKLIVRAAADKKVQKVIGKTKPGRGRGRGKGRGKGKQNSSPQANQEDELGDEPTPEATVEVEEQEPADGKGESDHDGPKVDAVMKQQWDAVEPCLKVLFPWQRKIDICYQQIQILLY